jgi:hypothetical protein
LVIAPNVLDDGGNRFSARPFNERVRGLLEARLELVFDRENNRTDRRHYLNGAVVQYIGRTRDDPNFGWVSAAYQQITPFGWHDLIFRSHGRALWGDLRNIGTPAERTEINFHNEDGLGEYTHGIFGRFFVQHAVEANIEFRFSVTRDLFKLSLFHQVVLFGEIDRNTGRESARMAAMIGPGLNVLIEGLFQLDIYGSFGVLTPRMDRPYDSRTNPFEGDAGAGLNLVKVF